MNPFRYQGPVEPSALINRAEELDALQRAAADRVDVRLSAPRRYGKSSLLQAHIQTMREAGHHAVRVDFYRAATVADVAGRILAAYGDLPDPNGLLERIKREMGASVGPGGISLSFGPRRDGAAITSDQARQMLLEALELPQRLYDREGGLTVICFDEFQDLLTADDQLDGLFRSVIQYHDDAAAYVYAGSRTSLMRAMFADKERPFYGQARPLSLPRLPFEETMRDLRATFARHEITPGRSLADIVTMAGGHPQRTMLLAHHLYNILTGPAGVEEPAATALDLALEETSDAHQAVWESLDRPERSVVVALADGLSPTGSKAASEHSIARSSLQVALRRLSEEEQHVVHDGSSSELLDPLFAEWIRRR